MTLTHPDFRLDQPNPSKYITDAEWWLWLRLKELEPGTRLGGIYANKSGYHNTGQANLDRWPGNYSVRDSADRSGKAWKTHASALDWTFPDAQRGDFSTIDGYTARVIKSGMDQKDPRLGLILREVYGQADSDRDVEGWDERREVAVTSDSSHLWHIHFSFIRSKCHDFWGMWALLTVLQGWSVENWRASLPDSQPVPAPKPAKPAGLPVHRLGSRVLRHVSPNMKGTDIATYQRFIGKLKADGIFGPATKKRTREYQDMRGYKVDGVAGPQTLGPIIKALKL